MQRIVHSVSCLVVALALVLFGPGASGPAKGDMLIEICSDSAISMLWVDAEGNPVSPDGQHTKCLDCLIFSAPLPGASCALPSCQARLVTAGHTRPAPLTLPSVAHLRPMPRGPPAAPDGSKRVGGPHPEAPSHQSVGPHLLDHQQVQPGSGVTGRGAMT